MKPKKKECNPPINIEEMINKFISRNFHGLAISNKMYKLEHDFYRQQIIRLMESILPTKIIWDRKWSKNEATYDSLEKGWNACIDQIKKNITNLTNKDNKGV